MTRTANGGASALFRHRPFLLFFLARAFAQFARQIGVVAVGWQIYALTGSAFALGMVGLAQFLPSALLTFAAGHVADRYDRRKVAAACQWSSGLAAAYLAAGSLGGWLDATQIFVAVALLGGAGAFESPAVAALLPAAVPVGQLQRGTAVSTGAFQVAAISGPALGGLAYAVDPALPYGVMGAFLFLAAALNAMLRLDRPAEGKARPTLSAVFDGIAFVRTHPAILGTISLDLFVVLLGGATALLPIYARDILHTGAWGLGVLRGAPALGALAVAAALTRWPLRHKVGMRLFQAVMIFGAATIVFAVSRSLVLSVVALGILGAADTISVVVRASLVQLQTPDAMRGRVGAVNFLFINASNQLGEFESGLTAAFLGAVPAAVLGGVGSIIVAALWMRLFPALRDVDRLE